MFLSQKHFLAWSQITEKSESQQIISGTEIKIKNELNPKSRFMLLKRVEPEEIAQIFDKSQESKN